MTQRSTPVCDKSPDPVMTALPTASRCGPADPLSQAHSSRYAGPARFSTSCDQLQRVGLASSLLFEESMIAGAAVSNRPPLRISTLVATICTLVPSDTPYSPSN